MLSKCAHLILDRPTRPHWPSACQHWNARHGRCHLSTCNNRNGSVDCLQQRHSAVYCTRRTENVFLSTCRDVIAHCASRETLPAPSVKSSGALIPHTRKTSRKAVHPCVAARLTVTLPPWNVTDSLAPCSTSTPTTGWSRHCLPPTKTMGR